MIDRTPLPPISRSDAVVLLEAAFDTQGELRARYLLNALCVIALVVGIDAFTVAMRDAADKLLKSDPN